MKAYDTHRTEPQLPAALMAGIGTDVASCAMRLQASGPVTAAAAQDLAELEALGLQLQACARVLAAPGDQGAEAVDLGVAALQARAEWTAPMARIGAHWDGPAHGGQVHANPAVLKLMIDLALAHALGQGPSIRVAVEQRTQWPPCTLRITASRPGGEPFQAPANGRADWQWELLVPLARHVGVALERQVLAHGVEVTLAFAALGATMAQAL